MLNRLPSCVATWLSTVLLAVSVAACGATEHESCASDDECQSGLRCVFRASTRICEKESEPYCRATSDCVSPRVCTSLNVCETPCQTQSDCELVPGCCGMECSPDPVSSICTCVGCD